MQSDTIGRREVAVIPRKTDVDLPSDEILRHPAAVSLAEFRRDPTPGVWIKPTAADASSISIEKLEAGCAEIRESWRGAFTFSEERIVGDIVVQPGLRKPQIGAIHAALGHWTASSAPATIVMPTGTGKTETMLALMVVAEVERLLVVVPSDALRTQISDGPERMAVRAGSAIKGISLGLMVHNGVLQRFHDFLAVLDRQAEVTVKQPLPGLVDANLLSANITEVILAPDRDRPFHCIVNQVSARVQLPVHCDKDFLHFTSKRASQSRALPLRCNAKENFRMV